MRQPAGPVRKSDTRRLKSSERSIAARCDDPSPSDDLEPGARDRVGNLARNPWRGQQVLLTHDDEGWGGDREQPIERIESPVRRCLSGVRFGADWVGIAGQ